MPRTGNVQRRIDRGVRIDMDYNSTFEIESAAFAGVRFRLRRMSFGRRLELMKKVRELAGRMEYFQAGGTAAERIEAAVLSAEIERLYLLWGIERVEGLCIDGSQADLDSLFDRAPEALCVEAVAAVKQECGLTEDEQKN